jgi:dihydropteroate synthase
VVPVFEELRRVLPAIQHAVARGAKVSIDTVKPEVARQALSAGARIVNDVSCASNPDLLQVVAEAGAELVIMHNRGRGERDGDNVRYADVTCEVSSELGQAVERAVAMGVAREDIWLDPGIGFAKTGAQSASLIAATHELVALGYRVLMGPSRKSFIAELAPRADGRAPQAGERLPGTLAAVLLCALGGCHAVRVHDVAETHQALAVLGACVRRRA